MAKDIKNYKKAAGLARKYLSENPRALASGVGKVFVTTDLKHMFFDSGDAATFIKRNGGGCYQFRASDLMNPNYKLPEQKTKEQVLADREEAELQEQIDEENAKADKAEGGK